jgi:hypothetical protein
VALDISEREFLVLFGGLAGLATSVGRTGARVYSVRLVGATILTALDPILGPDWYMAERRGASSIAYVLSVDLIENRNYRLLIRFRFAREVFLEQREANRPTVEHTYASGEITFKFQTATTGSRLPQAAVV